LIGKNKIMNRSVIKPIIRSVVHPLTGTSSSGSSPTNFVATAISSTEIDITWDGAGELSLERSTDGITYSVIATISDGINIYHDTGLTAGTLYYYRGRFAEASAETPASYPSCIDDGDTKGFYLVTEGITKDGSDRVSKWADFLESERDLVQATALKQPLYTADGLEFNGSTRIDCMKATFAFTQPCTYYIVVKMLGWTDVDFIFDGHGASSVLIYQTGTSPGIKAYAGTLSSENDNLSLDTLGLIRVVFNGASSKFQINKTTAIEWNAGSTDPGGFTIGAQGNQSTNPSNILVPEIILRDVADGSTDYDAIGDYLIDKYSI